MRRLFADFIADENGATAIEYCLIASGIALVIVVAVQGLGTTLNGRYGAVNTAIK